MNKISRTLLFTTCVFFLLYCNSAAIAGIKLVESAEKKAKVLLLGIDGVQLEKLLELNTPNFDRLNIQRAYTGGIEGSHTQQQTSSGAAWATILTGVWANKHEVVSNSSGLVNKNFPGLYQRIHNFYKEASKKVELYGFATWKYTHTNYFWEELKLLEEENHGGSDLDNLNKTKQVIKEKDPDFIFLHLDDVDHAGHAHCFGEEYNFAIEQADIRLGELLSAVEERNSYKNEDWLVLVVTDHGRDAQGCGHGAQTFGEKIVFIASNKELNTHSYGSLKHSNQGFDGLYNFLPQTVIAPTVLDHLGIEIKNEWLLESVSLKKISHINHLSEGPEPNSLVWNSNSDADLLIYRNGEMAASIKANMGYWLDDNPDPKINDYTLVINDQAVSYRIQNFSKSEKIRRKLDSFFDSILTFLKNIFLPFVKLFS